MPHGLVCSSRVRGWWRVIFGTVLVCVVLAAPHGPSPREDASLEESTGWQPVLLGLDPPSGPRSGGTEVQLELLSLGPNSSARPSVVLQPLPAGEGQPTILRTAANDQGLFFVTPNATEGSAESSAGGSAAPVGLLVTLAEDGRGDAASGAAVGTAPLLFRFWDPALAEPPRMVVPCCELKISGGEELRLTWHGGAPPTRQPSVAFRSGTLRRDVTGEVEAASGATEGEVTWNVRVNTPSWPRAEHPVYLEVSWNNQQYSRFTEPLGFAEEESFFGDVVGGISEAHIAADEDPASSEQGGEEGMQEVVTVVDDHQGRPRSRGQGPDLSHITLVDPAENSFVLSRGRDLSYLQEDPRLIHDLLVLTLAATLFGLGAYRTGTPSVIGFLLGGAVIGPGGCNAIIELVQVESVAELGVCLTLFCLGLEFSAAEMLAHRGVAMAAFLSVLTLCSTIVLLAAGFAGTPLHEALCIGLFASLASTPVSLRAYPPQTKDVSPADELRVLTTILVTQDMVLALLLAILPRLLADEDDESSASAVPAGSSSGGGGSSRSTAGLQAPSLADPAAESWWNGQLFVMAASLHAVLLVLAFLRRQRVARMAGLASRWGRLRLLRLDEEFFALVALSYAFMLAFLSDQMGLSLELGAFAAGVSIRSFSSKVAERVAHRLRSVKDVFAALFFGSIGLVVSGHFLLDNLSAILSVVVFVFILKVVTAFVPLRVLATRRMPMPTTAALRLACILAHVGEFGFVLAARGASLGVLSRHVYLLLVGANSVSLCLTPWLFQVLECLLPQDRSLMDSLPRTRSRRKASSESFGSEDEARGRPTPTATGPTGETADVGRRGQTR